MGKVGPFIRQFRLGLNWKVMDVRIDFGRIYRSKVQAFKLYYRHLSSKLQAFMLYYTSLE